MPEELRDVERVAARLVAVSSIRQVVHALWALASAQAPRADRAVAESETYLERVREVIDRLATPGALEVGAEDALHVVLGPERPFCGSLARTVSEAIPSDVPLALVGHWLRDSVRDSANVLDRVLFELPGAASPDEIGAVSSRLTSELAARATRFDIVLVFPVTRSTIPRSVTLLGRGRTLRDPAPETWSPAREVLEAALTEWLAGQLAAALAETLRAEVYARMTAADRARKNCDRHVEELERRLRLLRQEQITSEILDLVTGQLM